MRIYIFLFSCYVFYHYLPPILIEEWRDEPFEYWVLLLSTLGWFAFTAGYFLTRVKWREKLFSVQMNSLGMALSFLFLFLSHKVIAGIFIPLFSIFAGCYAARLFVEKKWALFVLITCVSLGSLLGGFTRMYPLLFILVLALNYYTRAKKVPYVKVSLFLVVGFLSLILMREYRTYQNVDLERLKSTYFSQNTKALRVILLKSVDTYHSYELYRNVVRDFPKVHNFYYGESLVKPLTFFIPRDVWKDKPESLTNKIPRLYYGSTRGGHYSSGFTIAGEFYVNFGVIGTVVLFFVFGSVSRFVSSAFKKDSSFGSLLATLYLSLYLSLMRGGISTTVIYCIIGAAVYGVVYVVLNNNSLRSLICNRS